MQAKVTSAHSSQRLLAGARFRRKTKQTRIERRGARDPIGRLPLTIMLTPDKLQILAMGLRGRNLGHTPGQSAESPFRRRTVEALKKSGRRESETLPMNLSNGADEGHVAFS